MRLLLVIVLCAAAGIAQEPGPSRTVLTNRDVETLADAGFSQEFLVERIGASRHEFDTTAEAIAELKKHGVKEDVIRAMLVPRVSAGTAAKPEFDGRAEPIRVFVQATPGARTAQTAEIVHTFSAGCPGLMVTNRKDAAAFLVVLERTPGKLLHPATNRMVVFDHSGDTVFGSERALPKAVREFCAVAQRADTKDEESLPGSRLPAR